MPTHPWQPNEPIRPAPPVPAPPLPRVELPGGSWSHLAEQRRILVSGALDRPAVTELAAQLMALDGMSSREVELVVNSSGGPLAEIFAVLDVIELMRAPVVTTCIGSAAGSAAALVASGTGERRAAPRASFSLRCDDRQQIEGSSDDVVRWAAELTALRERYITSLAAATGQDAAVIEIEVARGGLHDAADARQLGLIDTIVAGSAAVRERA